MLATALVVVCGLNACGDSTASDASRNGRYILHTINGKRPPAILLETANSRLEFMGGALRLNDDATFTDSTDIRVTPMYLGQPLQGGEIQRRMDVAWGLFRVSGDTVYFDSLRGEHYFMVGAAAGPLRQELAGSVLIYQK